MRKNNQALFTFKFSVFKVNLRKTLKQRFKLQCEKRTNSSRAMHKHKCPLIRKHQHKSKQEQQPTTTKTNTSNKTELCNNSNIHSKLCFFHTKEECFKQHQILPETCLNTHTLFNKLWEHNYAMFSPDMTWESAQLKLLFHTLCIKKVRSELQTLSHP